MRAVLHGCTVRRRYSVESGIRHIAWQLEASPHGGIIGTTSNGYTHLVAKQRLCSTNQPATFAFEHRIELSFFFLIKSKQIHFHQKHISKLSIYFIVPLLMLLRDFD